jgi:hypothetical protein
MDITGEPSGQLRRSLKGKPFERGIQPYSASSGAGKAREEIR